jgi:hypothetical protein
MSAEPDAVSETVLYPNGKVKFTGAYFYGEMCDQSGRIVKETDYSKDRSRS